MSKYLSSRLVGIFTFFLLVIGFQSNIAQADVRDIEIEELILDLTLDALEPLETLEIEDSILAEDSECTDSDDSDRSATFGPAGPTDEQLEKINSALTKFAQDNGATNSDGSVDSTKLGNKAIASYDNDGDSELSKGELKNFLKDYCVGNGFTRGKWADGLIDYADTDGNGKLTSSEISSAYDSSTEAE
jgi:hypothetical protein